LGVEPLELLLDAEAVIGIPPIAPLEQATTDATAASVSARLVPPKRRC
jgi:hypothetical protein